MISDRSKELISIWNDWEGAVVCSQTEKKWLASDLKNILGGYVSILSNNGVQPGDLVAVCLSNTVLFPLTFFALLKKNCIPVLLSASILWQELSCAINQLGIKYAIHDFVKGATQLRVPDRAYSSMDDFGLENIQGRIFSFERIRQLAPFPSDVVVHPTSGTSGFSRYCFRSQGDAAAEATNYAQSIDLYDQSYITVTTPMSHAFAFGFGLITCLLTNSSMRLAPSFNPRRLLKQLDTEAGDVLMLVPPMMRSLLRFSKKSTGMPLNVFTAGVLCPDDLKSDFEKRFHCNVYEIYGTTETGGITTTYFPEMKCAGVGKALCNVQVKMSDQSRYRQLRSGAGEIAVCSTSMMQGYIDNTVRKDQYFPTGDIGYLDSDGNVHVIGRKRDIINVGGVKIDPRQVERILRQNDMVADAFVYPGVYDDGSEYVQAALVPINDTFDPKRLTAYCNENIGSLKTPKKIHVVEKIRRSPSGKCLRRELPDYPDIIHGS